jgi:hypothetical protein
MSTAIVFAIVAPVAILAGLCAYIAQLLVRNGNRTVMHAHGTECSLCLNYTHGHHHDAYSSIDHHHDDRYAASDHDHDGRYVTRDEFSIHQHDQYVTRDELDGRLGWMQRRLSFLYMENKTRNGSVREILQGMLVGGLIGLIIGGLLDLLLPARFFQNNAVTTYNVGGQQIVQNLTSSNIWPYFGIPLGCLVLGLFLGGITLWIVQIFRTSRNNRRTEEV